MTTIKQMDRTCENCANVSICSPYRVAAGFENQFNQEWKDIVKLPFPAILLAQKCDMYRSPHERGMFDDISDEELNQLISAVEKQGLNKGISKNLHITMKAELDRRARVRSIDVGV